MATVAELSRTDVLLEAAAANIEKAGELFAPAGLVAATVAQVHATLALVEQQRIANLQAFLSFALAPEMTVTDEAGVQRLADQIVEGLGL